MSSSGFCLSSAWAKTSQEIPSVSATLKVVFCRTLRPWSLSAVTCQDRTAQESQRRLFFFLLCFFSLGRVHPTVVIGQTRGSDTSRESQSWIALRAVTFPSQLRTPRNIPIWASANMKQTLESLWSFEKPALVSFSTCLNSAQLLLQGQSSPDRSGRSSHGRQTKEVGVAQLIDIHQPSHV
jgi:hypothetical protein